MCAWRVPVTFIFNINYTEWRIHGFISILKFWEVYNYHTEVDDGDVKRVGR